MGSLLIFSVLISAIFFNVASAQLSPFFYLTSCPLALPTIKIGVTSAVLNERRMGASLLRLHFHDCFVNASASGCDASVLLDDTSNFRGEKTAFPNVDSLRGFDVIDSIKTRLEAICPGVVSCADILAVAARDSVVALGGPFWSVPLGRRDSTTASFDDANNDLPPPSANLTELVSFFQRKGLSQSDLVALSGSHTIGQARCLTFRDRIHNETNIDAAFATSLRSTCPSSGRDNALSALDVTTPTFFDAAYFRNLVANKGLLHSDQQLFNGGSADAQVLSYVRNPFAFRSDFAAAMIKMGNISPLTGANGQIRGNCRAVN